MYSLDLLLLLGHDHFSKLLPSLILLFRRIPEILSKVLSIWLDRHLNIFPLCLIPAFVLQLSALLSLVSFPKPHLGLIQPGTHVQPLRFSVCPLIGWQLWSKNHPTSSLQFHSSPPNSSTWETPSESQQRGAHGRVAGPLTRLSSVFFFPRDSCAACCSTPRAWFPG